MTTRLTLMNLGNKRVEQFCECKKIFTEIKKNYKNL